MGILIENCSISGRGTRSILVEGSEVARIAEEAIWEVPIGTEIIDANGASLFPGFADSHCHPFEFGWLRRNVDLRGTSNITGIRLRLSSRLQKTPPGAWVTGMGWDQESLPDGRMPDRADIDDLSPANPVALSRVCGHVVLLNSAAIESLGLGGSSGAESEKDPGGRLTGIFKEAAMEMIFAKIQGEGQRSAEDLLTAEVEAAKHGLTTLHCILSPGGYVSELEALSSLRAEGALSLRYRVFIPPDAMGYVAEKGLRKKMDGESVRINGVKIYADGSLGARTAALREPYSDDPNNSGLLRQSDEELAGIVERADSEGYQVIVHAIGDRGVEQAVGALSMVTGTRNPRRHRIEHASLLPPDLRSKMARHGIRAAVQPSFIVSDSWAERRLGEERVQDLYPFRSMLEDGILASGGSDGPIETMSPVMGIWASMVRGGFAPKESLTLDQGIRLYTENANSNGFDDLASEVEEGGPANLTLFDSDIAGMHPALLRKVGVAATIVDGKVVYGYSRSAD